MPLATMLRSLANNLGAGRSVVAHIIYEALSSATRARLQASVPEDRLHIRWTPVGHVELASLPAPIRVYDHISPASYFRLLLPDLLPGELDRVIYLDCDLIILGDIGVLWHISIDDYYAAAVPELTADSRLVSSPQGIRLWRELGLPPDLEQFNSGVLLINLGKWRDECIKQRCLVYLAQAADWLRWHDQEALNVIFAGDWLRLNARWNLTMRYLVNTSPETNQPPCIIHYHSDEKPWHADYPFAYREVFLDYLDQTAWAGWRPLRPPLAHIRRFGKRLVKALHKRQHAFQRLRSDSIRRLRGLRLIASRPRLLGNPLPDNVGTCEIRIFMVAECCSRTARTLIGHYLDRGSDRVLVAVNANMIDAWRSFADLDARVHLVVRGNLSVDENLRVLLHRYGQGHWCLLTRPDEWFRYPCDDLLTLAALTRFLDTQQCTALISRQVNLLYGKSVVVKQSGSDNMMRCGDFWLPHEVVRKLPITERDPVRNRIFVTDSYISPGQLADASHAACRSAVSLLKYKADMLIGPCARSVHGPRVSDIEGVILQTPWLEQADDAGQTIAPSRIDWHALESAGLLRASGSLEHIASDALLLDD